MPRTVTRPDLLERYEALGYSNRFKFEQKHGLPMNLMGKMKMGGYQSAGAIAALARLEQAIAAEEDAGKRGHEAAPLPGPAVSGQSGGRPTAPESLSEDDLSAVDNYVSKIEDSEDIGEVDECNKLLTVLLIRGLVTDGTARILKELLAERRQSLHAKQDREEKAKAGKELLIRVIFVRDWVGGPLPGEGPR